MKDFWNFMQFLIIWTTFGIILTFIFALIGLFLRIDNVAKDYENTISNVAAITKDSQ